MMNIIKNEKKIKTHPDGCVRYKIMYSIVIDFSLVYQFVTKNLIQQ